MGRSPCCEKAHTNKGAWTKEEDQRLINYIRVHGEGCWRSLPKAAGLLRCGKSCRLRWINYLRPDLKRGNFTEEEDEIIIKLHSLLGNKWSLIAGRLPGRTDNEIKNYWNTHIKRKLVSRGIDPQTHRSLNAAASAAVTPTNTTTTETQAVPSICLDFRNSTAVSPAIMETTKPAASFKLITSDISSSADQDSTTKCSSGTTTEEITQARPPPLPPQLQLQHVQNNNYVKEEVDEEEEELNLELSLGFPPRVSVSSSKSSATSYSSSADSKISYGFFFGGGGVPPSSRTTAAPLPAATTTTGASVMGAANAGVCLCWQLGFQTGGQLCRNCCQMKNGGFRYS